MRDFRDEDLLFTYEDLLAYAERWRAGNLTEKDRRLLAQGAPKTAYRQVLGGREYLIPLPRNIRLISVSDRLAKRVARRT